jgi:hypothetical protein
MPLIRPEDLMPQIVRRSFERISRQLSASIGGIYAETSPGTVDQVASCVFVRFKGVRYVVTATHVLREIGGLPLLIGCVRGSGSFGGEFRFLRDEDVLDIAIARMPAGLEAKLEGATFYDIDHCENQGADWEPDRCVIFGLPNTKNERKPWQRVPDARGVFGFLTVPAENQSVHGKPKISGRTHLILDWTGKSVTNVDGISWNPPKLKGTSGGAIINLGYLEDENVLATQIPPMPTIEGIVSLWVDKKAVVGVRFFAMITALNSANAWPL